MHKIIAYLFIFVLSLLVVSISTSAQKESQSPEHSVEITYDKLTYDFSGEQKKVILEGNIEIKSPTLLVLCDQAEILSSRTTNNGSNESATGLGTIDYILAVGNVDIQQLGTRALAGKAEIFPQERKLILEQEPRIIDENGTIWGHRITYFQGDRQIKIDPGDSNKRNKIELRNISEIDFLMGESAPATSTPSSSSSE